MHVELTAEMVFATSLGSTTWPIAGENLEYHLRRSYYELRNQLDEVTSDAAQLEVINRMQPVRLLAINSRFIAGLDKVNRVGVIDDWEVEEEVN